MRRFLPAADIQNRIFGRCCMKRRECRAKTFPTKTWNCSQSDALSGLGATKIVTSALWTRQRISGSWLPEGPELNQRISPGEPGRTYKRSPLQNRLRDLGLFHLIIRITV